MKLYNTLTRSLEAFTPLTPPDVTMYVCGPTVYDDPHIGHARSAYIFDVLRRYLTYKKYVVKFVRNVTDVDDKIIERARKDAGTGDLAAACRQVAERYLQRYHETMDRLGIARPDVEPKATEHVVPEMTDLIAKLFLQGVAYEAKDGVYFAVRKHPGYGKLSNRALDALQAGARVEPGEDKQDPLDFALWKAAKPDEPSWNSPWGKGRPGWHIECSAMSTKYLGDTFDIHGGGVDLVFPHHENEVAQAEAAGKPFAKFWVHNGLLTVNGEKMSKSVGNYITVEQVLKDWSHSDYLKIFFLKTHYRSPIDYSVEKMAEAKKNWGEFSRFFQHCQQVEGEKPPVEVAALQRDFKVAFESAMDDDLNTPKALSVLFDLVNLSNGYLESLDAGKVITVKFLQQVLVECGTTLGLFLQGATEVDPPMWERIKKKIAERDAARKAKDFKKADAIRQELVLKERIQLTDTVHGTLWRKTE